MAKDSPYGKKQHSRPSTIDRVILASAYPLPESLSLRSVLLTSSKCFVVAATCVAYTSPVLIIILTWLCLESIGMHKTKSPLQLPVPSWSSSTITLPKLSLPASFSLVAVVSTMTHVLYCGKHQRQQQQHSTQASALTLDHWKLRPVAQEAAVAQYSTSPNTASVHADDTIKPIGRDGSPFVSPFSADRDTISKNQPTAQSQSHPIVRHLPQLSTQHKDGDKIRLQLPGTMKSSGHEVEQCFSRLKEVHVLLFGERHALDWSKSTPRAFENAVFETGRLCGLVGVPSNGEAHSIAAVNDLLSKLNSALAAQ